MAQRRYILKVDEKSSSKKVYPRQSRPVPVPVVEVTGGADGGAPIRAPMQFGSVWPLFAPFVDSNGSYDMTVNGSVTPVRFAITPPAGMIWMINRLNIFMLASGMTNSSFGGIAGGLATGLTITLDVNGSPSFDILRGYRIKQNKDIFKIWPSVQPNTTVLSGQNDVISADADTHRFLNRPLPLDGKLGHSLALRINADLESITAFELTAFGWEEPSV